MTAEPVRVQKDVMGGVNSTYETLQEALRGGAGLQLYGLGAHEKVTVSSRLGSRCILLVLCVVPGGYLQSAHAGPSMGARSCSELQTEVAAIAWLNTHTVSKKPYEKAAVFVCGPDGTPTPAYVTSSFEGPLRTGDPCRTRILTPPGWIAAAHTHPFFRNASQYVRGRGCFGDRRKPSLTQLVNLNRRNEDFSRRDIEAFHGRSQPFYLKVPRGTDIKRRKHGRVQLVW